MRSSFVNCLFFCISTKELLMNTEECQIIKGMLAEIKCKNKLITTRCNCGSVSEYEAACDRMVLFMELAQICERIGKLESISGG